MHKLLAGPLAALVLAALTPSAGAATSFTVGTGSHPDVAVDAAGAAHIVYESQNATKLTYCKLPRGATACSISSTLSPPGEGIGRSSYVFVPSGGRVVIATHRSDGKNYAYGSSDGGTSFGPLVQIGDVDWEGGAVFGPGEAISGVSGAGKTFQRDPLSGPPAASSADLNDPAVDPLYGSVAVSGTTTFQAAAYNGKASFRRQLTGDANNTANWSAPTSITPGEGDLTLAGGPSGVVLLGTGFTSPSGGSELRARKFDGTTFPGGSVISTGDPIFYDLNVDSAGHFYALWNENAASPNEIRLSTSADGSTWSPAEIVLGGDFVDGIYNTQVAAAADGQGFGVFDQNSNTGSIVVTPLEPRSAVPTTPVTPDPPATNDPVDTVTTGGTTIEFFGPTACVQPPEKVTLRVTSKRKKKLSPKKRVKISQAVFYVDKTKKKDKKSAFKQSFSTALFPRGSVHKDGAVVTLKPVKKGAFKTRKKTLKGKFNVCG